MESLWKVSNQPSHKNSTITDASRSHLPNLFLPRLKLNPPHFPLFHLKMPRVIDIPTEPFPGLPVPLLVIGIQVTPTNIRVGECLFISLITNREISATAKDRAVVDMVPDGFIFLL